MKNRILGVLIIGIILFESCSNASKDAASSQNISSTITVGQTYQGGLIAHIFSIGELGYAAGQTHGIIVALKDYNANWGTNIILTDGTKMALTDVDSCYELVGHAKINTNRIINTFSSFTAVKNGKIISPTSFTEYAAKLCDTLVLNGYSDWYLPTTDELIIITNTTPNIGANMLGTYWSSVSYYQSFGTYYAYSYTTNGRALYSIDKSNQPMSSYKIRPIRYF